MKKSILGLLILLLSILAACRPEPVEITPTPSVTRSPYPTRTATSTMLPPTATLTPTETPIYPTATERYRFTVLNTGDWLEYAVVKYNFVFLFPSDWKIIPDEDLDSPTYKHKLWIMPDQENPGVILSMGYRFLDEDVEIQQPRMDSGELIINGNVSVMGEDVVRELWIQDGLDLAVFYNSAAELRRNQLAMTLILEMTGTSLAKTGLSLEEEQIADQILASIRLIEEPTETPTMTPTNTITPTITRTATITPTGTLPTATPTSTVTPTVSPTN